MARIEEWIAKHPIASLTLFMFATFTLGTVGVEIVRINIRFAMMTQEMAEHPLGLFPTLNGEPYADYPSLYNLLSYLAAIGGRWVNRFSLALPTILLSCYVVAMTAKTSELIKPGTGVCAALFSLFSFEYINIFMAFSIDLPVAAAAITIVWSLLKFDFGAKALPIYAGMLVFAFAVRGPLGLIMCGAVTAGVILGARRWMALLTCGAIGAGVTAACLGLAYRAILRQGGDDLWHTVTEWQVGSRIGKEDSFSEYFYYFTNAIGSFMPVTGFAIAALIIKRRELTKREFTIPLLWALLPMLMLSIPSGKHLRYMTSLLPAFAILAANWYVNADDSWISRFVDFAIKLADKFILPVGAALVVMAVAIGWKLPVSKVSLYLHLAVEMVLLGVMYFTLRRYTGKPWPLVRCALAMALIAGIAFTSGDAMWESSSSFIAKTEKLLREQQGRLYLYKLSPDHDALKVMYHISPETRKHAVSIYQFDEKASPHLKKMFPVVTAEEALAMIRPEDVVVLHLKELEPKARKKKENTGMRKLLSAAIANIDPANPASLKIMIFMRFLSDAPQIHQNKLKSLREEAEKAGLEVVVIDGEGRLGHKKAVVVKLVKQDRRTPR